MEEVLKQAERLGQSIASSDRYRRLKQLRDRIEKDLDTSDLLSKYQAISRRADEADGTPDGLSAEEQQELAALDRKIRDNIAIQQLLRAQADFAELMSKVHRALESSLESSQNDPA